MHDYTDKGNTIITEAQGENTHSAKLDIPWRRLGSGHEALHKTFSHKISAITLISCFIFLA